MPYVSKQIKKYLDESWNPEPTTPGELNYLITKLLMTYVQGGIGPSYTRFNDAIGALECAKLEFYRRSLSNYEEKKIVQNGDVYPRELTRFQDPEEADSR